MQWDESLLALFEDLEQQAEGLRLSERDAEIADRMLAEYAGVDLAARVHASTGNHVRLKVQGVGPLEGTLMRAGHDWCLVEGVDAAGEWIVAMSAVLVAEGLSQRAVSAAARSVVTRLGLGSVLRRLGETRAPVVLRHVDGSQTRGTLSRVGADFVEVLAGGGDQLGGGRGVVVVPFAGLALVRAT